jgi:hypothetical protein
MTAEDLQLNQVWRNNIARRQRMADVKLRHAGRHDAAFSGWPITGSQKYFAAGLAAFT